MSYNGISIEVVRTLRFEHFPEPQRGPGYKWHRVYLHVQGYLAGLATSYDTAAVSQLAAGFRPPGARLQGDPVKTPKMAPQTTQQAIVNALMQKRKQLLYATGAVVNGIFQLAPDGYGGFQSDQILESPYRGIGLQLAGIKNPTPQQLAQATANPLYVVDAGGGPNPIIYNVTSMTAATWKIEFAIETFINLAYQFYKSPPLLLSNVFENEHSIDQNGFTTISTRGEATWNMAVATQQVVKPDDFRGLLFAPIPAGCQRTDVRVRQKADLQTFPYQYTDREQSHTIIPREISRIEAVLESRVANQAFQQVVHEEFAGAAWRNFGGGHGGGGGMGGNPWLLGAQALSNGVSDLFSTSWRAASSTIPERQIVLTVRVWGHPLSLRKNLAYWLRRIIESRLAGFDVLVGKYPMSTVYREDLMGRYVDMVLVIHLKTTLGIFEGLWAQFQRRIGNNPPDPLLTAFPNLEAEDIISPAAAGQAVKDLGLNAVRFPVGAIAVNSRAAPGKGYQAPYGPSADRSTFIRACIASAFWNADSNPPVPVLAPVTANKQTFSY